MMHLGNERRNARTTAGLQYMPLARVWGEKCPDGELSEHVGGRYFPCPRIAGVIRLLM